MRLRQAFAAALVAGLIAGVVLWAGPSGADTAAHEYQRWLFMRYGFVTWDNGWYSGRHVFVTYSWLYYPLAAWLGIKPLAVASVAVAAGAFSWLVRWTPAAVAFAAVWGLYAISGAYPFMLGVAFGMLALCALRRAWLFIPLAFLTWAASPLALLLLAVVVAGLRRWRALGVTLTLVALQVVLAHVYHGRGHFPFRWQEALAALVFAVGGAIVSRDTRLRGIFVAYALLVVFAVAFESQLGENAARLRFMALPLGLLAVRGRAWWIAVPLVALCGVYNLTPLAWSFNDGLHERATARSYWHPALTFLAAHANANYRVNALDTVDHWEAVWLPRAGFAITRGWYRQDDFPENKVLYSDDLTREQYLTWLHERAVRYVLVPRDRLDYSSRREATLATKLHFVTRAGAVAIYEVPSPRQIVPGAQVLRLRHDSITIRFPHAGRYAMAIRGHESYFAPRKGVITIGLA